MSSAHGNPEPRVRGFKPNTPPRCHSSGHSRSVRMAHPPGQHVPCFREFSCSGIHIDLADLPAGFVGKPHIHQGYHALFVLRGQVEDRGLSRHDVLNETRVRLSPTGDRHLLYATTESRIVLLSESTSAPSHHRRLRRRHILQSRLDPSLMTRLVTELDSTRPSPIVVEEIAVSLLNANRWHRAPVGDLRWVERIADRLHKEFNQPLSLTDVCEDAGVSREHAIRAFRARFGCTMGQYITQLRIAFVRDRLATDTPLAVLALDAGFADQSHMTRVVTRTLGASPAAIRRSLGRDTSVKITFGQATTFDAPVL